MDVASLVVAICALLAALYVGLRQVGMQKHMTKIEEARRQEEVTSKQEADVTAGFERYDVQGYRFVLYNRGPAQARDVSFEMEEHPAGGHAPALLTQGHSFQLALLDPDQRYQIPCAVAMGTAQAVQVDLRWHDGTGQREKQLTLAVY
jgi:hypothetical protein